MRRILAFLLACAVSSPAQMLQMVSNDVTHNVVTGTPTILQRRNASSTLSNSTGTTVNLCPTQAYCLFFPSGAQAGNTFIGWVRYSNGTSVSTVADDKSDTCAVVDTANDTTNSVKNSMWYCKNLTAGAIQVTITFSGATTKVSAGGIEANQIDNTSPLDTHAVNTSGSGSSTVTSGSITPSASNYFLCEVGARTQTPKPASFGVGVGQAYVVGSQSNITWSWVATDAVDGTAMQCGKYTASSAINPSFTMSSNSGYAAVGAFFKTAPVGAARPSGIYRAGICEYNEPTGPATIHVQCVTDGNFRLNSHGFGGTNYTTSSISDSQSSTYVHATGGQVGDSNSGKSDMYWVTNTSGSNALLQDIVTSGTASDYTVMMIDVVGAATSPVTAQIGKFQNTNPTPPITLYENLGTGNTDGITLMNLQEAQNTCQSVTTPTGGVSDATLFGGENISGAGTNPPSENNCWLASRNTDGTTQQTWKPGWADSTTLGGQAWHLLFVASSTATTTGSTAALMVVSTTHSNASLGGNDFVDYQSGFPMAYSSNTIIPSAGGGGLSHDAGSIFTPISFPANQGCQFTINAISGGTSNGGQGGGCQLRATTDGGRTGYRIVVNAAASGQVEVIRQVSGATTTIGHCTATTTPAANDVWNMEVSGTGATVSFTIKQNGSSLSSCSLTDTSGSRILSGQPGLGYSSTMTSFSMKATAYAYPL